MTKLCLCPCRIKEMHGNKTRIQPPVRSTSIYHLSAFLPPALPNVDLKNSNWYAAQDETTRNLVPMQTVPQNTGTETSPLPEAWGLQHHNDVPPVVQHPAVVSWCPGTLAQAELATAPRALRHSGGLC